MDRSPVRSRATVSAASEPPKQLGSAVAFAFVVVLMLAIGAHTTVARHAGGFWRDEANTLAFANMASLRELFANLRHDSAPPSIALLARAAMALGLRSDGALRAVGAAIGFGTLVAMLAGARSLGSRLPVATLALFALNAWVVRGGDALRPQGLGMLGVTLAFVAAAHVAIAPGRGHIALAAAASAFAALCAWTTLPLLGAIAAALLAIAAREGCGRRATGALAIAAAAALALTPFAPALRAANEWSALVRTGAHLNSLPAALAGTMRLDLALWALALAAGLFAGVSAWRAPRAASGNSLPAPDATLARFAVGALVLGAGASLAMLHWSALPTQPWYHLPLIALACLSLDLLLTRWTRPARAALPAAAMVILLAMVHSFALAPEVLQRATNVDLHAGTLTRMAAPGDFLVVTPWQLGVSYSRVAAPGLAWSTLPPLADTRIHRYDLVREAMRHPEVSEAVDARALATLAEGHRVFVLGALPPTRSRELAPLPPPAPGSPLGWNSDAYTLAWTRRFVSDLMPAVSNVRRVELAHVPVSPYEAAALYVLEGKPSGEGRR